MDLREHFVLRLTEEEATAIVQEFERDGGRNVHLLTVCRAHPDLFTAAHLLERFFLENSGQQELSDQYEAALIKHAGKE